MTEGYNTFEFIERAYVELALGDVEQAHKRDGVLFVAQRMNHAKNGETAFVGTAEALTEALALFGALSSEGMLDVVVKHARERIPYVGNLVRAAKVLPLDLALETIKTFTAKAKS